jgi:hypothetical protein
MSPPRFRQLPSIMLACSALATTAWCGDLLTVADQKGRSLIIDLVALADETVTFTRQGDAKEYKLSISQFDPGSQERIRKRSEEMAASGVKKTPAAVEYRLQPGVVIGKRRRDKGNSYYMEVQEVTNLSTTVRADGLGGTIVFFGRNTRKPDVYNVLSTQKFEASVDTSGSFSKDMEAFTTTYDSDNKGAGNLGGYQYYGYVLALFDSTGKPILTETATGNFRMALANKAELLDTVLQYAKGTTVSDKLEPMSDSGAR